MNNKEDETFIRLRYDFPSKSCSWDELYDRFPVEVINNVYIKCNAVSDWWSYSKDNSVFESNCNIREKILINELINYEQTT